MTSLHVSVSFWAFLFMLSLITLLLTHLISIWTDLILILLPCNLNARNYCNYAAEGNSSSEAGRPKFRVSWQGQLLAGWTHSHLRAGSPWEYRCPPLLHLSEIGILGFILGKGLKPLSGALGLARSPSLHLLAYSTTLCCSAQPGRIPPLCRHPHPTHIPRVPYL